MNSSGQWVSTSRNSHRVNCRSPDRKTGTIYVRTYAGEMLHYLLMVHRRVISVRYVTPGMCMDHHELMCDALRMSQNLRKLHVVAITTNASQDFVAAAAVPESPARARCARTWDSSTVLSSCRASRSSKKAILKVSLSV